jgi:hypothetical protein
MFGVDLAMFFVDTFHCFLLQNILSLSKCSFLTGSEDVAENVLFVDSIDLLCEDVRAIHSI